MKFEEVAPPLVPPIARFISKKKADQMAMFH